MKISYNDYNEQSYHVISIITVLLKCAGDVQEVPTHKPLHQVLDLKINKEQIKWLFVCITTKTITQTLHFSLKIKKRLIEMIKYCTPSIQVSVNPVSDSRWRIIRRSWITAVYRNLRAQSRAIKSLLSVSHGVKMKTKHHWIVSEDSQKLQRYIHIINAFIY